MTDETTNILLDEFRTMRKDVREDVQGIHARINDVKNSVVKLETEVGTIKEHNLQAAADLNSLGDEHIRCQAERQAFQESTSRRLDDVAGRVSEVDGKPADASAMFNGKTTMALNLLSRFGPWVVLALIGLGAYLGTGGDMEKTAAAIERAERVVKIAEEVTEELEQKAKRLEEAADRSTDEEEPVTWQR